MTEIKFTEEELRLILIAFEHAEGPAVVSLKKKLVTMLDIPPSLAFGEKEIYRDPQTGAKFGMIAPLNKSPFRQ